MGSATPTHPDIGRRGLVERDEELATVRDAVDGCRAGTGAAVLIQGPAGVGRSALLAAATEHARACGIRVGVARGSDFEAPAAFGVLRALLAPLLEPQDQERTAVRAMAAPGDAAAGALARGTLFALLRLLTDLGRREPFLLGVDDAQWADAATLRALAFCARRVEALPLALVVTVRTRGDGALTAPLLELLRSGARVLRPSALRPPGTAAVLGTTLADAVVDTCHVATGGNPGVLAELAAGLRQTGAEASTLAAEETIALGVRAVAPLVAHRLSGLPAEARLLAQAAAIVGGSLPTTEVGALAGLAPEAVEPTAALVSAADLATGPGQAPPLIRAALRAGLPAADRERLARAAAERLRELGWPEPAAALCRTELPPRADAWVGSLLVEAAEAANARGATQLVATLAARAVAEPPAGPEHARALALLGAAELQLGEPRAVATLEAALAVAVDDRAAVARLLADAQAGDGLIAQAVATLDAAIETAEPATAELLEALLAHHAIWSPATRAQATARLHRLGDTRGVSEPAYRLRLALLADDAAGTGGSAATAAALAERALAGGRLLEQAPAAHRLAALTLAAAGRPDLAGPYVDQAVAHGNRSLADEREAVGARAQLALRDGNVVAAELDARAALALAADGSTRTPALLWVLADALVEQDRPAEAEAALRGTGLLGRLPESAVFLQLLRSRGSVRVATGSVLAGLEDLLLCGARERAIGPGNPALNAWRAEAVAALVALDRHREARALAAENSALAAAFGAPAAVGAALRVEGLARGGSPADGLARSASPGPAQGRDDAARWFADAVDALEGGHARLELARAQCELGCALLLRHDRDGAEAPLEAAAASALALGAAALAARANAALAAAGGRTVRPVPRGAGALTASERRVAQLASRGHTNPAIAAELYVSLKTVETHLSRTYRKLGISSRTQLPRLGDG